MNPITAEFCKNKKTKTNNNKKKTAVTGDIFGGISTVLCLVCLLVFLFFVALTYLSIQGELLLKIIVSLISLLSLVSSLEYKDISAFLKMSSSCHQLIFLMQFLQSIYVCMNVSEFVCAGGGGGGGYVCVHVNETVSVPVYASSRESKIVCV